MLRKLLLLSSFLSALFADAHIFVYHRFEDFRYPSTNTSLKELKKEFEFLKKNGYKVISLEELVKGIKNKKIDKKWVVLTIDDGFRSFLKAKPLFEKFGYKATIFISTKPSFYKYRDFLTFNELKDISKSPLFTVAFHSHAHPHLCKLTNEQIKQDTLKGLKIFEKYLGFRPKFYAYPYGEYDKRVKDVIKSFNFLAIANQNRGAISTHSVVFDLDRIALVGKSNIKSALKTKYLKAQWIEPKKYPKDNILKVVKAKISPKYKNAKLYISGYGWQNVEVKEGFINKKLNLKLTKQRVRVIIKVKNSKINTKLLVRSCNGAK